MHDTLPGNIRFELLRIVILILIIRTIFNSRKEYRIKHRIPPIKFRKHSTFFLGRLEYFLKDRQIKYKIINKLLTFLVETIRSALISIRISFKLFLRFRDYRREIGGISLLHT